MKIQVKTTTTQEREITLPHYVRLSEFQCCKIVSETEVICAHVWDGPTFKAGQIEQRNSAQDVLAYKHEEISANEFRDHLNKAKQIIDEAYNKAVIKLKVVVFGERNDYKAGEVVVWNGKKPCICKIKERSEYLGTSSTCFASTSNTHNSLHYLYLRPATSEEIELLGENEIHYL
jgi:hypothetical protein